MVIEWKFNTYTTPLYSTLSNPPLIIHATYEHNFTVNEVTRIDHTGQKELVKKRNHSPKFLNTHNTINCPKPEQHITIDRSCNKYRKHDVLYYNSIYDTYVSTKINKESFATLDKCFPKPNRRHITFNRHTVKFHM